MAQENRDKAMALALDLAFQGIGSTSPNPSVGAVLVKGEEIIATGQTDPCGGNHAEINALKNCREDPRGADLYVSLEPCCHYGKTPPCTEAIIRAGIRRVCIPVLDPNSLVAGKGLTALREGGVEVEIMERWSQAAVDLLRPFRKYIVRRRPFVIHKTASTLDGRIASSTGDSRWISSEYARFAVHRLRCLVDAVLVGKTTFVRDNPSLNVRLDSFPDNVRGYYDELKGHFSGYENFFLSKLFSGDLLKGGDPLRVVAGLADKIDLTAPLFKDENYIIFATSREWEARYRCEDKETLDILLEKNRLHILTALSRQDQVWEMLALLRERGCLTILLEGGGRLAGSFLDAGEIDQYLYFINPRILGNGQAPLEGKGFEKIGDSLRLQDVSSVLLRDEIVFNGYRESYHIERV